MDAICSMHDSVRILAAVTSMFRDELGRSGVVERAVRSPLVVIAGYAAMSKRACGSL